MPLEIGSNNLKTPATVIDKIMDYLAVCRLTLERGHQSHLFTIRPPLVLALGSYRQLLWRFRQGAKGPSVNPAPLLLSLPQSGNVQVRADRVIK